ncbi:AbrB/MazE/SpoVT family DNA-binding domain-containing protein [Thermaerobacter composti]|uniref:AbrB/MazE/SpoVT family DNA-binding domain-containing protein n=1 Tax=Thermaerobacter composti TaxID=554949 RepID=A0ABZ0QS15_9FIRM|nr:AbrB/MazE/SpoVT family DNA-binding domain-containing protein [Thermaerobacter composti]
MSRVGPKGQVVLPKAVREALGILPGDRVIFHVEKDRVVILPVRARTAADLRGMLSVGKPIDLRQGRKDYQDHLAAFSSGTRNRKLMLRNACSLVLPKVSLRFGSTRRCWPRLSMCLLHHDLLTCPALG